mgnify:CR=1 FL=1
MFPSQQNLQWIRSFEDAAVEHTQNGFSRAIRAKLAPLATVDGGLQLQSIHAAGDGTRKMVFRLANGPAAGGQVRQDDGGGGGQEPGSGAGGG